ncbi:MAG: type II secretion system protein [Methylobacter sp.]
MKQLSNMKQQSGFTLIELVMVIVILGILAATALPKFADLGSDARSAVYQGAVGAINSAAVTFYAANKTVPTGTELFGNVIVSGLDTFSHSGCAFSIKPTGGTVSIYTPDTSYCSGT